MDYIRVHYYKSMKNYLYVGIMLIIMASILRFGFWTIYTTEAGDISFHEDSLSYPDLTHGEKIRIHGSISDLEYFEEVDTDTPKDKILDMRILNQSSEVYVQGLMVLDNLTIAKEWIHNDTINNLLVYNGEFSKVILENLTFE